MYIAFFTAILFIFVHPILAMENQSLQEELMQYWISEDLDLTKRTIWDKFLEPNELNPNHIGELLEKNIIKPGIIITTGAHRAFYLVASLPENKQINGIVVIDINPKTKAFVDFNKLLIQIAQDRNEYNLLANEPSHLDTIRERVEQSNIHSDAKKYYLDNLEIFGKIFYQNKWAPDRFKYLEDAFLHVRYDKDDLLFEKIKRYCVSGNMIAVCSNINDLSFLSTRNIAAIDASNIHHYVPLAFTNGKNPIETTVIFTSVLEQFHTEYASFLYKEISSDENKKHYYLLIQSCEDSSDNWAFSDVEKFAKSHGLYENGQYIPASVCCEENIKIFTKYCKECIFHIPNIITSDFTTNDVYEKLRNLTAEQLDILINSEEIIKFKEEIIKRIMPSNIYCLFAKKEWWKKQFEEYFALPVNRLPIFLRSLEQNGMLDNFKNGFGHERLAILETVYRKNCKK